MIKFKSNQTELKLNKVLYCIEQSNKRLNKNNTYDDYDINALSSVFNLPIVDIKKIYKNYNHLKFISIAKGLSKKLAENITK